MPKHHLPPFLQFVCALLLLCSAGCLTMADLQWSNPRADVVYICDKPLDVPEGVNLWAWNSATGQLVTGDDPAELRWFAHRADVLFEYDPDAPRSSISRMPPEYGLTCAKPVRFLADAAEFFHGIEPGEVTESVGRGDPRFFAAPAQGKKKDPVRVHVCVRPSWVKDDVGQWSSPDVKKTLLTASEKTFLEEAGKADVVFIFDDNAHPESACWFTPDPTKLSCPGKRVPKTCSQAVRLQLLGAAMAPSLGALLPGPPKQGNGQTTSTSTGNGQTTSTSTSNGQTTSTTAANTASPKKGDGQTTSTSGPDGNGPPLTFVQMLARNLAIAGALASGDTSGSLKDPNGSRYGIPSGKNAGGPDLLLLQAAAGTFAIIGIPFKSGKEFIDTVTRALSQKKVAGILDPKVLSREIAEKLAEEPKKEAVKDAIDALKRGDDKAFDALESFGKAMAPSLRDAAVILPYSRAKIFTRGWEGKFQAHHILEVEMGDKVFKLGKAIDDIPAIILSKEQHEFITAELTKAHKKLLRDLKPDETPSKAQVWAMYQEVYKGCPSWLEAIKGYFPNVP